MKNAEVVTSAREYLHRLVLNGGSGLSDVRARALLLGLEMEFEACRSRIRCMLESNMKQRQLRSHSPSAYFYPGDFQKREVELRALADRAYVVAQCLENQEERAMNTKQKAELLAIAKMAESISFQAGTRIGGRGCDNWLTEQADELAARAQALIADADPEPQVDVAALRALSSSLYQGGHKDIADVIAEALFGDDT